MQAFSLSAQFARESAMLKLPEERRRWGESKGAGREKRKRLFFSPPPPPFPSFALAPTVRVTISTLPNLPLSLLNNNITNTNKVSPTHNTPALQATQLPTLLGLVASVLAVVCKRMQQLPTTRNMQQGVQTDATCNIQQCCVRLHGD